MSTATPTRYATTPCRQCGEPVVIVSVRVDGSRWQATPLDPAARVYTREGDGEGGGVWVEWRDRGAVMAQHRCKGATR